MENIKRKGARSIKDIPPAILERLNRGEIETANLVEWLATDQELLLKNLLSQHPEKAYLDTVLQAVNSLRKRTVNTLSESIGRELGELIRANQDGELWLHISTHSSDLVRCWACYIVVSNTTQPIAQILQEIKPFAADSHFGVREVAWMAVRPYIAQNLPPAIQILSQWASDSDANIRRFASEATRPRGVWCAHITELKQTPALGVPILEALRADPARYVQDSVGNWLNDAAKSQPEFVRQLCQQWLQESNTPFTQYIVKRARRSIGRG